MKQEGKMKRRKASRHSSGKILMLGLSEAEAAKRSKESGLNELPTDGDRGFFYSFFAIARDPMFLLLLACGGLYLILGELKDSLVFLLLTFFLIILTLYQQRKTERALRALKDISAPLALVIRGGVKKKIDSRFLVVGDIVEIHEGSMVPADGVILTELNLLVNEAILTGESAPVKKNIWDGHEELVSPGGDDLPFVFSGTTIVRGLATIKVTAIAGETQIGKIGRSLAEIKEAPTLLEQEIKRLIKWFAIYGVGLSLFVVLLFVWLKHDLLSGVLNGLSLAMAVLPEELTVIIAVFMALGAWRMAKSKALAKKGSAIETLGAVSVLCVDKTGTITKNASRLTTIRINNKELLLGGFKSKLPAAAAELLRAAYLACAEHTHDPLELEIKSQTDHYIPSRGNGLSGLKHLREYPLSRELFAMTNAWQLKNGKIEAAAKGAPEAIANLCHLTLRQIEEMSREIKLMSDSGLRVLAAARAVHNGKELPLDHHHFDFKYLGLIGFADPIRKEVPAAVKECREAGVRIIMVTGDYPLTAQYIARKIGLENPQEYITGSQLMHMSKAELKSKIKYANIFARILPEQKLMIVEALKANGEVVAMTGDGVNDAPALKAAHIGIAMGEKGTDVARETADLILLNDDFSTIVKAIKMGRRIFDNLRKATAFVFAIHLPIAGLTILPLLTGLPIFFLPIHIAFMELIIDPACSLVFETEEAEPGIMKRPPRRLDQSLFDKRTFIKSLVQGFGVLLIIFLTYILALNVGQSVEAARTIAFVALVMSNLFLIIANLSYAPKLLRILKEKNLPLVFVAFGSLSLVILAIIWPPLRDIFHFSLLNWLGVFGAVAAALIAAVWLEGFKLILPQRSK